MKKIYLLLIFLVFLQVRPTNLPNVLTLEGDYYIYCVSTTLPNVDCGEFKRVKTSLAEFDSVISQCKNIKGVTYVAKFSQTVLQEILSKLNLANLNNEEITYGYSNKLNRGIYINGVEVNVQIACVREQIYVGYPILLGSY
ncbi:MAG: hypothetical protein RR418_01935 [Clostridia bacterium]